MSKYVFLFGLDSTITKQEILPTVSKKLGIYEKMCTLTECTARGEIPFKESFLQRVELLKKTAVSEVNEIVYNIELNNQLVDFVKKHRERCYIVTGNLDVWISALISEIGMEEHLLCSKAIVKNNRISEVVSVLDKSVVGSEIKMPFVAVGDGNNDAEIIRKAKIGIGYGGVCEIAPSVIECATHAFYDENKLVDFLQRLL